MSADLYLEALHDTAAFAEEQRRLGQIWTLVGYASDLPQENDWFRTTLGGHSIFIQRFAEGLRGFENRCAHRSYPLRTTERGTGPVICGFHNWRYDAEGNAVGIPNCPDSFGTTPGGLNRRLAALNVAGCGDLIFARFPGRPDSLAEFLGPIFDVLSELCASMAGGQRATLPGRMNWRLSQWISLDDYHLAAVHPKSLATKGTYLRQSDLHYRRCGDHSAFLRGADPGSLEDWGRELRLGVPSGPAYRIVHLFPNASVTFIPTLPFIQKHRLPCSYVIVQRHLPVAFDRTDLEIAIASAPLRHLDPARLPRWLAPLTPLAIPLVRRGALRVLREDQEICEHLQKGAHQIAPNPLHGASEIRVAWFNEAYANAMRMAEPAQ